MRQVFEATLNRDDELGLLLLTIEGHFTIDEKQQVDSLIADALSEDATGWLLDLTALKFIDSAGLMTVLSLYNKLDKAGKPMAVVTDGNKYAQDKLQELGLMRIPRFQAFESAEEAKRALARSRV